MFRFRHPSRKSKSNRKTIHSGDKDSDSKVRSTSSSGAMKRNDKKSKIKHRRVVGKYFNKNVSNFTGDVLSIEGILDRVVGYLPSKQRYQSCTLVSKFWRQVVIEEKQSLLTLCIEDRASDKINKAGRTSDHHYHSDDIHRDETFRYPLYAIGRLPSWVAAKATKLVLVLRFVKQHSSRYNLDDFLFYKRRPSWFLDRFSNLQVLIIFSEFASDQFVSILNPPSTMVRRQVGIPSLKKIQYEETNVSNWRHSYLKTFVELAPNLEILQVRENMKWKWKEQSMFFQTEDISNLLPISRSLQELVLFNRPNIRGNFTEFLAKMPLLQSWDIYNSLIDMGDFPRTLGRVPQNFEDNTYRHVDLNEHPYFTHYARDEVEFLLTMQDILVPWFLGLDDANIHPWKNNITHMIGYIDAIMMEYFETGNNLFDNRPFRPYRLPTLTNLLEVDDSFGSGRNYANYCCASRNKTKLKNYVRAVKPCMELYYDEFLFYFYSDPFGLGYDRFQERHQHQQLKRLIKRITHIKDYYRKRTDVLFGKVSKGKDFSVLV